MEDIFVTNGLLDGLHGADSFSEKNEIIHHGIQQKFDAIDRIAVVLYDSQMDTLTTFIHSSKENPISFQECRVADIFDALTSERPYKDAWTNDAALDELKKLSGAKLNVDCVNILMPQTQAVEQIQNQFRDESCQRIPRLLAIPIICSPMVAGGTR